MIYGQKQIRKCSNCVHIDRETYKAVKVDVCYKIERKDDKPVAVTVTDKTLVCGNWRD